MSKKQRKSRYGEYCEVIDGKLYGSVNLQQGNGTYKKKRKRFDSKFEAKQWAVEQISQSRGKSIQIDESTTFTELAAWYKQHYLIAPVYEHGIKVDGVKDWKRLRAKLDKMSEYFGPRPLASITNHDLNAFAKSRRAADTVSTATINRDFALMRAMFIKGREANKLLVVPKFPINRSAEVERDRVLSFDEETRLLNVCVDKETITYKVRGRSVTREIEAKRLHLAGLIILAVDTAMRSGEIFKLTWPDIDLERDIITIRASNSKTERRRTIGMTPRVKAILLEKAALDGTTGRVFAAKNAAKAFATACTRAEIADLHFHDLRHTATTRMIRAGIPHTEVMKITGHTQIRTFLRYLNLGNETVQNAASQLGRYIDDVTIIESDAVN